MPSNNYDTPRCDANDSVLMKTDRNLRNLEKSISAFKATLRIVRINNEIAIANNDKVIKGNAVPNSNETLRSTN